MYARVVPDVVPRDIDAETAPIERDEDQSDFDYDAEESEGAADEDTARRATSRRLNSRRGTARLALDDSLAMAGQKRRRLDVPTVSSNNVSAKGKLGRPARGLKLEKVVIVRVRWRNCRLY